MIVNYDPEHIPGIVKLWNSSWAEDGYKELTEETFREIFIRNPFFKVENTFVQLENGAVAGFACGCTGDSLPGGDTSGYLTCAVLSNEIRDMDNFKALLDKVEKSFIKQGKKYSEVLFFNPIMLPWYIPGTDRHEHNNAPGAPVGSFFHIGLLENGYRERTREAAMYLRLQNFTIPRDILDKENTAAKAGYEVTLYDPARHTGMNEMLTSLGNKLWLQEITDCASQGIPVLVAANNGRAAGFAGPIIRSPSGRGYFAGIGVQPEHEGRGLGSILFFKLCREFEKTGAGYMSLYTGTKNPALKIYLKAGFSMVREFAVMRKEL